MPVTVFVALLAMSLLLCCGRGEVTAVNDEPPDILAFLSDLLEEIKGFRADMQMIGNKIPCDCKSSVLLHDDITQPVPQIVKPDAEPPTTAPEEPLHVEPASLWRTLLGVRSLDHAVQVAGGMIITAFAGMVILFVLVRFVETIDAIRNAEERAVLLGFLVGIPTGLLLLFNICSRYVFT